jgi:hypothetical protein
MVRFFVEGNAGWYKPQDLQNRMFMCGFCDTNVSSGEGYRLGQNTDGAGKQIGAVYLCPNCGGPSFFTPDTRQFPLPALGNYIQQVPQALGALYEEAKRWTSQNCHTAAVLLCRKMLMNIAVERGASEGLKFIECVCYLSDKGYVPPKGKRWVDDIRKKGNEATHDITLAGRADATDLVGFLGMLLRFIYGFPKLVPAIL